MVGEPKQSPHTISVQLNNEWTDSDIVAMITVYIGPGLTYAHILQGSVTPVHVCVY